MELTKEPGISVTETGEAPACACGAAYIATAVPTLLAGKFR